MRRGAVILCGGRSSRMGLDKATLPFGAETMLQRIVRLLNCVVGLPQMVVVKAQGQQLPQLPPEIQVVADRRPFQGPLEGIATGLQALKNQADAAYVTSCDVPLLEPAFVDRLFQLLTAEPKEKFPDRRPVDIVIPQEEEFFHPLAAVYRVNVLPQALELLAADQRRPAFLLQKVQTLAVPVDDLRTVDPQLWTLMNVNSPADYERALTLSGMSGTPPR